MVSKTTAWFLDRSFSQNNSYQIHLSFLSLEVLGVLKSKCFVSKCTYSTYIFACHLQLTKKIVLIYSLKILQSASQHNFKCVLRLDLTNLQIELTSIFELFRSTLCSWQAYCQVPYYMIYNFSSFIILFLQYVTLQTSLFNVTSGDSPNLTMAGPRLLLYYSLLYYHYTILNLKIPKKKPVIFCLKRCIY